MLEQARILSRPSKKTKQSSRSKEEEETLYSILEVNPNDTNDKIEEAWKFQIAAFHPDRFPDGPLRRKAEERTKLINEARDILLDPDKRRRYDEEHNIKVD
jgi:DnaJ family protein B protein 4